METYTLERKQVQKNPIKFRWYATEIIINNDKLLITNFKEKKDVKLSETLIDKIVSALPEKKPIQLQGEPPEPLKNSDMIDWRGYKKMPRCEANIDHYIQMNDFGFTLTIIDDGNIYFASYKFLSHENKRLTPNLNFGWVHNIPKEVIKNFNPLIEFYSKKFDTVYRKKPLRAPVQNYDVFKNSREYNHV